MSRRMAGAMSLVAFAMCLAVGIAADNTLATSLKRALYAMGGTLMVGMLVGWAAQKMLDDHLAVRKKKVTERENSEAKPAAKDR